MSTFRVLAAGALGVVFSAGANAACEFDVEVGDSLKFSVAKMAAEASCGEVTVRLTHTGSMPPEAMGHNWVLAKTADVDKLANDSLAAGLAKHYVPPGDARVIAATRIVGGGNATEVRFSVADLKGGDYTYFCSFPGHSYLMRGKFTVD